MSVNQKELGRRLRAAREACRMTQEEVARGLGLSRSGVAQIELGNRAITGLELERLAYLFGRDMREFFAEEFHEEDALVALFRVHPDMTRQTNVVDTLRRCLALGREVTNLERLLGIDRDLGTIASYPLSVPRSKWEAIQQGERVAQVERHRLQLGLAPLANVTELLETQSVRTAQINLPEDISGVTWIEPSVGLFVVANCRHHILRRRFSHAHEYAHVLLDRERRGTISRVADRHSLSEIRANAFAANFLMPEEGVWQFITALGKGAPSRRHAEVFGDSVEVLGNSGVVRVLSRAEPRSQDIQLYDVVHLAHHFGVSRLAALYRLYNLGFVTGAELERLKAQEDAGRGKDVAALLGLPEPDHEAARDEFRHRFLSLALEAVRQGAITRAKLQELVQMVDLGPEPLARLLCDMGLGDREKEGDVLLPEA
jgi:Zn-dependent peptidase ImmA (M78 family)/transcriptional regulator with XRE-family HTH domain